MKTPTIAEMNQMARDAFARPTVDEAKADCELTSDADSRSFNVEIETATEKKSGKKANGMYVPVTASGAGDAITKAIAWMKSNGFENIKTGKVTRSGRE